MQICGICGKVRPDSQNLCDCAEEDAPAQHLTENPISVFTAISLLTSFGVETVLLLVKGSLSGRGFGAIGAYLLAWLLVMVGAIVNVVVGCLAHRRGEVWGGWIAALGVVVCVATMLRVAH